MLYGPQMIFLLLHDGMHGLERHDTLSFGKARGEATRSIRRVRTVACDDA